MVARKAGTVARRIEARAEIAALRRRIEARAEIAVARARIGASQGGRVRKKTIAIKNEKKSANRPQRRPNSA